MVIIGAAISLFGIIIFINIRKLKNTQHVLDNENILHLNVTNFQKEINNGVVLVDFWAAWCMPCKILAPILNETATEIKGNARIGKLNVEECQIIASKYGVRSIPTMILFKNGKEINRFVGVKQKDFLLKQIDKASLNY